MNKKQKALTWIALFIFLLTLLAGQWDVTSHDDSMFGQPNRMVHDVHTSPIWNAPTSYDEHGEAQLMVMPLVASWAALGIVYGILFALFKAKRNAP